MELAVAVNESVDTEADELKVIEWLREAEVLVVTEKVCESDRVFVWCMDKLLLIVSLNELERELVLVLEAVNDIVAEKELALAVGVELREKENVCV